MTTLYNGYSRPANNPTTRAIPAYTHGSYHNKNAFAMYHRYILFQRIFSLRSAIISANRFISVMLASYIFNSTLAPCGFGHDQLHSL